MIDLVLVLFVGIAIGAICDYLYEHYREWKLDEVVDLADRIKHNTHFRNHLRSYFASRPDLREKFGFLYDYLLEE